MLLEGTVRNGMVVFDPSDTPPPDGTRVRVAIPAESSERIQRTAGICGGEARIAQTRIPVWLLVVARRNGRTDTDLLADYPALRPADLRAAWEYAGEHEREIETAIWWNDTAANVPPGSPVPAEVIAKGRDLGIDEDAIAGAFDHPPISQSNRRAG